MIPKILHQIGRADGVPPRFQPCVESWRRHLADWTIMPWNERTLLDFVASRYPQFLPVFCGYQSGVARADAGRYLLLHHFGGVHADIDCECVVSFDSILGEDRIVLCKEADTHARAQAGLRGLPYLLFSGTMASPKDHPFWLHLLSFLPGLARAKQTTDATGPCVLTSAQLDYPDQGAFAIHPAELFSPASPAGKVSGAAGTTLAIHHRAGQTPEQPLRPRHRLRKLFHQARHRMTRGAFLDEAAARQAVSRSARSAPAPSGRNLAILVPLRDAAQHIEPFFAAMHRLDYPKDRIKLAFCEGDSTDDSWERLEAAASAFGKDYRGIVLLRRQLRTRLARDARADRHLQRARRSGIAKVRNHLIDHGLSEEDDWALWIDIDVWRFPPDVVTRLIAAQSRIVVPHCVKVAGGDSFDLNSFVTVRNEKDHNYYRHVRDGLHQPPPNTQGRLHLSDVRHLDRIGLDGVGGTMLLVDAALHRGGLRFPELPYRELIETEGFGALANDLGIRPIGLPKLEILHVPW